MKEIREFVRQLRRSLAQATAVELGKIANNQYSSIEEAKAITGRCDGFRRAEAMAMELMNRRQDAADGADLPEMET